MHAACTVHVHVAVPPRQTRTHIHACHTHALFPSKVCHLIEHSGSIKQIVCFIKQALEIIHYCLVNVL